jgi:hypothetical protein
MRVGAELETGMYKAARMVPRGRIELPTPAFSGPRSTDELPRHGDNQRFYGKGAGVGRKNGARLNHLVCVEALWAAHEGAAEFVEAKDTMRVLGDSDANAFADRANFADGRA